MFKVIGAFLQPYMTWIIGGAVALVIGTFSWMAVDNAVTHSRLNTAQSEIKAQAQTIKAQERAVAAIDRVDELSDRLDRLVAISERRIMQAEGANDAIPQAVADAWAAGDDGLRNEWRGHSGSPEALHDPR